MLSTRVGEAIRSVASKVNSGVRSEAEGWVGGKRRGGKSQSPGGRDVRLRCYRATGLTANC